MLRERRVSRSAVASKEYIVTGRSKSNPNMPEDLGRLNELDGGHVNEIRPRG